MKIGRVLLSKVVLFLPLFLVAGILLFYENHLLWKIQELNLFLFTSLFFKQQMGAPGGMLTWLGTFFTQFLFYPWLGVLVLCSLWGLLMWLVRHTFRITNNWSSILLIPVALLLVADIDMGYWIYTMKLRGWFFIPTIGVCAMTAVLWAFRSLPSRYGLRIVFVLLVALLGYPLFGVYAIASVLLMGIWAWWIEDKKQAFLTCIVAVLVSGIIPLFFYRYVYYQTNISSIFFAGFPLIWVQKLFWHYFIPYLLLAIYFIVLIVWDRVFSHEIKRVKLILIFNVVLFVLLVVYVYHFWYKDENFHHELAMQHYIEQTKWEDVLKEAESQKGPPTRMVVVMRNLALSRLGRQGDEMYNYPCGTKSPNSDFVFQSSFVLGAQMFYQYGLLNDSHQYSIETGVEFGWRVENLKYLARCALLQGNVRGLHKYTGLLKHTLYYRKWAEILENLQGHTDKMAELRETGPILHMLHYPEMIGGSKGQFEENLMTVLAGLDSDDPYFQEQCLLATLWTKDANQFWERFIRYLALHPSGRIPRHYQEAAYLFAHINRPEALNLPYSAGIKESYAQFMQLLSHYDGRNVEEVRPLLWPKFGNTFYFDYYLMRYQN